MITRRTILRTGASVAPFFIVPRHVLGGGSRKAPSDKLNLAAVGVGGMGAVYLQNLESESIGALCDVDQAYAAPTFRKYPSAKRYVDFREMLDKEKNIDAVVIGAPDHHHAWMAVAAMRAGKGVYCAKPMARTIAELRMMMSVARETKVATQMSVQSCASDRSCRTAEWIRSGAIGKVREVHIWSDRPIWPQAVARPTDSPPPPSTLDWNRWLGPAPVRPYHPAYAPFVWRGWWDFGTGALGDMGCHVFHPIIRALDLGSPEAVEGSAAGLVREGLKFSDSGKAIYPKPEPLPETAPAASIVTWTFGARGDRPPVRLTWYDGGLKPPRPERHGRDLKYESAGLMFVGDSGVLMCKFMGGGDVILPRRDMTPPKPALPRTANHYQEFAAACKSGTATTCPLGGFGGELTELVLLGNVAVRLGRRLEWDPVAGRFHSDEEADRLLSDPYRKGWKL